MPKFWIWCGKAKQHRVEAADEEDAIQVWLAGPGAYDSIEHAAAENFVEPHEIVAKRANDWY